MDRDDTRPVDRAEDFHRWQAALAGRADVTLRLFADLNHLMAVGEGKSTPAEYTEDVHVDAGVVEFIADWCGGRTNVASSTTSLNP